MAKVYDIPSTDLIVKLAERIKMDKKIEPPDWVAYVKTGSLWKKFLRIETGGISDALDL